MKKSGSSLRYILPFILFVLMVGVIAWIAQFLPNWRGETKTVPPGKTSPIKFTLVNAVWDPEDTEYALEMERGKDGHFDFPFENTSDQTAEIGLKERSCDCSHLEVCVVTSSEWQRYSDEILKKPLEAKPGNWSWEQIAESDSMGFEVPPGAKGLVRVEWHGRRAPRSLLNLNIQVWHQPKGFVDRRVFEKLTVPTVMAAPIRILPPQINVSTLGPGDSAVAEFTMWSATRDSLDFRWEDPDDPLFVYARKPMSPKECRDLEKKLRKEGENTRIRAGCRFQVTVKEQAAGKQMAQGPFYHEVSFLLKGKNDDIDEKIAGPQILGAAKGEFIVGDKGKVDLSTFQTKVGAKRTIFVWAKDEIALTPESQSPATLEVDLKKGEKNGNTAKWLLQVTVPPNTQFGSIPEGSVIILRSQTTPPRYIRIPVTGNGQS